MKKIACTIFFCTMFYFMQADDKSVESVENIKKDLSDCKFDFLRDCKNLPSIVIINCHENAQFSIPYNLSISSSDPKVEIDQETKTNQENEQTSKLASEQMNVMQTMFDQLNAMHAMQEGLSNKLEAMQNQQGQSQSTAVKTDLQVTSSLYAKQMTDFLQQSLVASEKTFAWLQGNSLLIGGAGLAALYSSILYKIYQNNKILDDPAAFVHWKNDTTLEQLFATQASQLESELLYLFYHRYIDASNPLDGNYALIQSSVALDKEIELIADQIWLYQWIMSCRCTRLFFIDVTKLADLQNKHKKLLFMKHIFRSWCVQSNIEKNSNKDSL